MDTNGIQFQEGRYPTITKQINESLLFLFNEALSILRPD
jgi:hypothetical protein